jgi:hypothetical protein
MVPSHNLYGGYGGLSRGISGFQRTLIAGHGPYRRQGSSFSERETASRSNVNAQLAQSGRTTIVQPGQPYYFGTRVDKEHCRFINNLCRCHDPNSHGNAWTGEVGGGIYREGRPITFLNLMHRVLDPCGTTTVSLDQEIVARMVILHTRQAANLGAQERDFR